MKKMRSRVKYKDDSDFSVTYKLNKINGVFNWYPYTEGFSKPFVDKMLNLFDADENSLILDPFSGCGTTALGCTLRNIPSLSIEVNPFMDFIGQIKNASLKLDTLKIKKYHKILREKYGLIKPAEIPLFLKDKPFFNSDNLKQALIIKNSIIKNVDDSDYANFFLLHLSSILVKISDMVRAVDLRYKKNKLEEIDVFKIYDEKIISAISDLDHNEKPNSIKCNFINEDICNSNKAKKFFGRIDFFITSPPYLNGTNYDRNTKLEMGFMEFVNIDEDLKNLRYKMVTAGINSTHSNNVYELDLSFLTPLIDEVEKNAYDRRIPIMVKGYFNDMSLAMKNTFQLLKKGGRGVIVIGDSQFGGVHIETDIILAKICELIGFKVESIEVVRKRRSKNGMKLQETLIFVKK